MRISWVLTWSFFLQVSSVKFIRAQTGQVGEKVENHYGKSDDGRYAIFQQFDAENRETLDLEASGYSDQALRYFSAEMAKNLGVVPLGVEFHDVTDKGMDDATLTVVFPESVDSVVGYTTKKNHWWRFRC